MSQKSEQNFPKTNSNKLFPSKAIAIKIVLSKTARFYFEHIIIIIIIIIIITVTSRTNLYDFDPGSHFELLIAGLVTWAIAKCIVGK